MKKIMFNDMCGLTQAVLERRKTMTRRIINHPESFKGHNDVMLGFHCQEEESSRAYECVICDSCGNKIGRYTLPYNVGDEVAIAQSYKNAGVDPEKILKQKIKFRKGGLSDVDGYAIMEIPARLSAGWTNKMYVQASLMPHSIRIKSLRFERLMGVADKDCFKEGVTTMSNGKYGVGNGYNWEPHKDSLDKPVFFTPRAAFAALIDRVAGKGTWLSNPWVIVYEFELVK